MGSILFLIYVNDLPNAYNFHNTFVHMTTICTDLIDLII